MYGSPSTASSRHSARYLFVQLWSVLEKQGGVWIQLGSYETLLNQVSLCFFGIYFWTVTRETPVNYFSTVVSLEDLTYLDAVNTACFS